ncbi:DNA helicase RecQ [Ahrensia sp. R2A130]|uniref:DNA helicase RecQ n=1 Tax=Ahrensia sp. R2A130 TaxID=744979 RepID=UPI00058C2D97|nr:DNA helicase RecQ [Ahrensia sp. R2A130]
MSDAALATAPPVRANVADKHTVLKDVFGYDKFRPGQEEIIDTLLDGTSVLAVMPTGAGKSLCFQVPALAMDGLCIVVSPLVALMQDQVSALRLAGVAADAIHSNQDRQDNVDAWYRVTGGETRILYMAPERLMTERMLGAIANLPISLFAIDEAHCMSQWGPSFRPEYASLGELSKRFPTVPIAAMTATADEATRRDIELQLFDGNHRTFVSSFDRPNITLNVAPKGGWKNQLLDYVGSRKGESGIVYCLSRKKTEEAAEAMREAGINATAYHAGLEREERAERQNRFVTEDDLVVAATIAFGMGIDKPDVRFVFHTDLPGSVEAYYQEIGRAGRDGDPADSMMIFGAGDIRLRRQFIEQADGADDDHKRREVSRLNALITYAEAQSCRRQTLLAYFGDESQPCGNCDNCKNPVELKDATTEAELVFGAIIETGERYGQAHIIDVLCGAETEKVVKVRHDRLECHGTGERHSKPMWQSIIRQMCAAQLLEVDVAGYSSLLITKQGNALSRGQGEFRIRMDPLAGTGGKGSKAKSSNSGSWGNAQPAINLSERDRELLTSLKKKRLELAKERGVPAYVIFPDKTLTDMAQRRPTDAEEFSQVKGVGKSKLDQFGEMFMDVVRAA